MDVLTFASAARYAKRRLVTAQRGVQPRKRIGNLRLPRLVDDVDFRVVGDRL
jgi:hypothetical protein